MLFPPRMLIVDENYENMTFTEKINLTYGILSELLLIILIMIYYMYTYCLVQQERTGMLEHL